MMRNFEEIYRSCRVSKTKMETNRKIQFHIKEEAIVFHINLKRLCNKGKQNMGRYFAVPFLFGIVEFLARPLRYILCITVCCSALPTPYTPWIRHFK